ncbi:hypothetical protein FNV43_RR00513 [Rhamnella rubrinervis]|uniref:Uncharacterized protein n=1 Tax=Rhamnella rubrinervis TaxID=2594499 RepID=A0A8K0MR89_9ROSA|nr:hypothetical protein FNV43_RR00513 [Rhamnella rubrinervis]
MPIFLHFFYLKPGGEGRYVFYARKQTKLLTGAPTSDKGWKDRYFFVKKEGPNSLSICAALNQSAKLSTNTEQNNSINIRVAGKEPQPFTLRIISMRLLYGELTDPLWASYPTVDMGKMKVAAPTAEQLAEKERKRKEKKAARKAGGSGPNKQSKPTPGGTITVQPKDLRVAAAADKSPPHKKQRHLSPSAATKGKEPLAPQANLVLEDSSSIRSDSNLIAPIVDCLMTRHDKSILKSMPLEDICHEAEQGALKPQSMLMLGRKREKWSAETRKGKAGILGGFLVAERDEWRTEARLTAKKKIVYRKGVEDAYLRAQKEMILKFKAGQTSWPTPEPSEDEGDDGETSEISSNESESEHVGQPEDPPAVQEGSSSPTRDSFIEAMEATRTDDP